MDKKILICAAIIFILASLGILAYNNLEIYQRKRIIYPSDEVSGNNYYALEQWLMKTGHNVRVENLFIPYMLPDISEKIIMINSNTYIWRSTSEIIEWIEKGRYFIIDMAYYNNSINNNLSEFLFDYGITVEYTEPVYNWEDVIKPDDSDEKSLQEIMDAQIENEKDRENISIEENSYPAFNMRISFTITENDNITAMKDSKGNIRLVEIPIGDGILTVTGLPIYMYNNNLKKEANAFLTWSLTGARLAKNDGILFIRNQNTNTAFSLFGSIIERGNFPPVIISAIILIIAGFWMVIPSFGKIIKEKQQISRPIKDRLTAEIRFLKKYDALDYYIEYMPRGENKNDNISDKKNYNYNELLNQFRRKLNGTGKN